MGKGSRPRRSKAGRKKGKINQRLILRTFESATVPARTSASAKEPMFSTAPTERLRRGDLIAEMVWSFEADDPGARVREVVRHRVAAVSLKKRLAGFARLQDQHRQAAELFERDCCAAAIEQRVTVNPDSFMGGGRSTANVSSDAALASEKARFEAGTRLQKARKALRVCGQDITLIVESVVLFGVTSRDAGAAYARTADRSARVATALEAGLSLLSHHYQSEDGGRRIVPQKTEPRAA